MLNKQRFKRGNLVKIKSKYTNQEIISCSLERGIFHEQNTVLTDESNRFAIIEGSFNDLWGSMYPNGYSEDEKSYKQYSVVFLDTGYSLAWLNENELEFISDGSEKLFEQAKENNKLFKEVMEKED